MPRAVQQRGAALSVWAALAAGALGCSSLPVVATDAATDGDATPERDAGPCGHPCGEGVECINGVCSRRVVQLSAELNHTCARLVDGSVWCWGSNESGEVGDGSPESTRSTPSRVPGVTATSVAAGWSQSCAVVADGRVRCWGSNGGRVIADDARAVVRAPEEVAFPGRTVSLTVGFGACALSDEGVVHCRSPWGTTPASTTVRWADHVVAMDGGWGHVCVLHDDGTVGCGGRRVALQIGDGVMLTHPDDVAVGPVRPLGLPRAVGLAASAAGTCVRTDEGALWCWGGDIRGAAPGEATPARLDDVPDARELWSRGQGFIVRGSDGALRAWGSNTAGGVGDGTTVNRWPPVAMTALDGIRGDVVSFAGGVEHVCALLTDQTVRCWGGNVRGQIGNGALGARVLTPQSPRW